MTDNKGIINIIEDLLGSGGSKALATAMLPLLRREGYVTFDAQNGFVLGDVPEGRWLEILAEAEPSVKRYEARMDGVVEKLDAEDLDEAKEAAEEWVREGSWSRTETLFLHACVVEIDNNGDETSHPVTVTLDPIEPSCAEGREHDWQAPFSIVGGIKEAPGTWGHGGGVTMQEVCVKCGCGRLIDTWAQDPETGEQGLRSVTYEEDKYALDVKK